MRHPAVLRIAGSQRLLVAVGLALLAVGCASPTPNRDPLGETFPSVRGESLERTPHRLPEDFAGKPVLLLVGYVQNAQFDADRWLLGLLQAEVPVQILEVPTIPGLFPRMLANTIDSGMRKGIPSEDWKSVVTVYRDAADIVRFTGNTNPRNMRVLLLDEEGRVVWFHDRGYSAGKLLELDRIVRGGTWR